MDLVLSPHELLWFRISYLYLFLSFTVLNYSNLFQGKEIPFHFLISRFATYEQKTIHFFPYGFVFYYIIATYMLMGYALLPTTFLAVLSGFVFGWVALPFLILGYTLATIIGYQIGKKLDKGSLDFLLGNYPKAAQMIVDKRNEIPQLIFFVRLSPVIPFALSNLLFALLKIDLKKVVWIGLWGMLPRTLLAFTTGVVGESLVGALEENSGLRQWAVIGVLLLVSGWGIYRFFKK